MECMHVQARNRAMIGSRRRADLKNVRFCGHAVDITQWKPNCAVEVRKKPADVCRDNDERVDKRVLVADVLIVNGATAVVWIILRRIVRRSDRGQMQCVLEVWPFIYCVWSGLRTRSRCNVCAEGERFGLAGRREQ